MNKRLQQFLAAENISQSQFADRIGVGRASISHILAGRNKPGYEFMENLAREYPRLNLDWLVLGKGKMYKNGPEELFPQEPAPAPSPNPLQAAPEPASEDAPRGVYVEKIVVFYSDGTYKEFFC